MNLHRIIGASFLAAYYGFRRLAGRAPRPVGIAERLAAFPRTGLPLRELATIHWDAHQIPFIEARNDHDLAVGFGLVHAHLRWTQIEIMRCISRGRIAEMIGPAGIPFDHTLRILDFGRAVPAMEQALPPETRNWLLAFLEGINHYIGAAAEEPPEFPLLALKRKPWSLSELLTLSRLAATDVNWLVWSGLLRQGDQETAREFWWRLANGTPEAEAIDAEIPGLIRSAAGTDAAGFSWDAFLRVCCRAGSNSFAVAGSRSESGGALLASDPHLSLVLPNLWMIAGGHSPNFHAVGLMIPGLPFIGLGRNPWIGWGGTSLHAASSDLFDITDLPPERIGLRQELISVRWWGSHRVTIRDTEFGPVLSDAPFLRKAVRNRQGHKSFALRWIGHEPSDETTALYHLNRARNWAEFRDAFDGFALPGQNMVYADTEGHIGKLIAARLPRRALAPPSYLVLPTDAHRHWERYASAGDFPISFDPEEGMVVSANERPSCPADIPVGYLFSSGERHRRLTALLSGTRRFAAADLAGIQMDVFVTAERDLRDFLLDRVASLPGLRFTPSTRRFLERLAAWDGRYGPESTGAPAYEVLIYHLGALLFGKQRLALYASIWGGRPLFGADIRSTTPWRLAEALPAAIATAAADAERFASWGEMHRFRPAHPLGSAPFIGGRFRFGDIPVGGSTETVFKTGHGFTDRRHATSFGTNARHISDLADPDRNLFVLLGGQDGWPGSANFLDQLDLWREGRYVEVPLRLETVRARFPHKTELTP
jgi:penicillin G amidase